MKMEAPPPSPASPVKKSRSKKEKVTGSSASNFKVVKLVWEDAVAMGEWQSHSDLPESLNTCSTIGYLVKENKQFYYVSSTVSLDNTEPDTVHINATMCIPKKWVKKAIQVNLEELNVTKD